MAIQVKWIDVVVREPGAPADSAPTEGRTPRTVARGRYGFDQMADDISNACSLTRADVAAALTAMLEYTQAALLDGQIVELEGIGRFRITVEAGLCTPDEAVRRGLCADDVIRKYNVRFRPDARLSKHVASHARAEVIDNPIY